MTKIILVMLFAVAIVLPADSAGQRPGASPSNQQILQELTRLRGEIDKLKSCLAAGVHVDLQPGRTDSDKIDNAIAAAQFDATRSNKTITVFFSERVYRLNRPIRSKSHVAFASLGAGHRSTRLSFARISADWWPATESDPRPVRALVTLFGGTSASFRGIEIRTDASAISNVVGLNATSLSNTEIERCKIDLTPLKGVDHIGIRIERIKQRALSQSVYFEKCEIRAAVPVYIVSGDNLVFRDCDWTGKGEIKDLPNAILVYGPDSGPDHHTFEGSQTWQGRDHAIWIDSNRPMFSSALILRNVRYEQSTGGDDDAAWHIVFHGDGKSSGQLESLTLDGCRNSQRKINTRISGVRKIDLRKNSFLYGSPANDSTAAASK